MKRAVLLVALVACGDNTQPLTYKNPPAGGKLRLVQTTATAKSVTLAFEVGDAPLTGYSTGFDLPLDAAKVTLASFTPGTVIDPGPPPVAAMGVIGTDGPLAGQLVTAQSAKATNTASDVALDAGAVLFTLELDLAQDAAKGVVFDGTASGFALPSGGLRDRVGNSVVDPPDVAIGKLYVDR